MGNRHLLDLALSRTGVEIGIAQLKRFVDPGIAGLEVTQAIQYYGAARHLTDPNDRGNDNSVTLVANKPAWVRVYVRSGILGNSQVVTGELKVDRRIGPFPLWTDVATLAPQAPGSVATQSNPDYATERSTLISTLNFVIPATDMWGHIRLTARLWIQGGDAAFPVATHEVTLDVTLLQTLRLRGVMISYNGPDPTVNPANPPNINLAAPTVADLQATAAWTLTTNPVESQGNFSSAGTVAWSTPLTGMATSPGGCSTQWLQLNAAVAQVKTNDGNRTDLIYYGLLPAGTPIANVGGCESSGVSTGPNGQQVTMAHEVGHGAGLAHGPCGTPGDASYPAYEPYDPANTPTASIGEYGLNVNNGAIAQPAAKDYMSYCGPPRWISLYHHGRLVNNPKFDPRSVGTWTFREPLLVDPFLWPWEYLPDPPPWERHPGDIRMKADKLISIVGIVDENREMQVQSVMRVTALPAVGDATHTRFAAQLIGANGAVVASAPVMRLDDRASCGGCEGRGEPDDDRRPFAFQALLQDVEPGAALRIVRHGREDEDDEEVWERRAPDRAPAIDAFRVTASKGGLVATWKASGAKEQPLSFALQFSRDDGRSWNSVAVGLTGTRFEIEPTGLPAGPAVFRLLAHDGFFTATAESEAVNLPRRPPVATILHPQEGPALMAGYPMRLWAAVNTGTGRRIDPEACVWLLDGEEAARGPDTFVTAPREGKHRCTLQVRGEGGRSEVSVTFATLDPEKITWTNEDPDRPDPGPRTGAASRKRPARKGTGGTRSKR